MEILENLPLSTMYGQSFYSIFKDIGKQWLVIHSDVALNGVSRIVECYSKRLQKDVRIYCFQPKQGFCACMLIEKDKETEHIS